MEDEFCQKVDLNLDISIDLPANAPQGHPHLLNVKRPRNNPQPPKYKKRKSNQIEFPEDLSLVDVLATILFDWKPAALHHLLNVQNEQFYCAAEWEQDNLEYDAWERFVYVHRLGQYVRIAIMGIDAGAEVSYRICNDKRWEIISAQNYDAKDNCTYWVPSDLKKRAACKKIEKRMAELISQRYLVDVVLQDMNFPVLTYEFGAEKSKICPASELNNLRREPNTESSSDSLMEGNINARVTELEAQVLVLQNSIKELVGPAGKRRREG